MNFYNKVIILFLLIYIANNQFAYSANVQDKYSIDILLIGSSYFNYNDLAELVENLSITSGKEIYIEMCGQNGMYLSDHAESIITEAKINEKDWDIVVLQGVGPLIAYPEHFTDHPVYPALISLRDKIYNNCETTRIVFCMPWAFEDGMTWYQNWTDTYEDMQIYIYNNTIQYSNDIGFEIAPVGSAWYGVLAEYNYPLHYLHLSDWNHPSIKGSYLTACVIYSVVFIESTVGNQYFIGVDQEEASFFQNVASDTVLNKLNLWNINTEVSTDNKIDIFYGMQLHQNYPNPFNETCKISYQIPKRLFVNLTVYDYTGELVCSLINALQDAGKHELEFNRNNLPGGVYFYKLSAGNKCVIRPMLVK